MLRERLRRMEIETEEKIIDNFQELRMIRSLQNLLGRIDHSAELIPEDNTKKIIELLESLKGEDLSKEEIRLLGEIEGLEFCTKLSPRFFHDNKFKI